MAKQFKVGDKVQANDQHGWANPGKIVAIATPEWIAEHPFPKDFDNVVGQINVQFGSYPNYEQYWYKASELSPAR